MNDLLKDNYLYKGHTSSVPIELESYILYGDHHPNLERTDVCKGQLEWVPRCPLKWLLTEYKSTSLMNWLWKEMELVGP